jgi:hypothetical protein
VAVGFKQSVPAGCRRHHGVEIDEQKLPTAVPKHELPVKARQPRFEYRLDARQLLLRGLPQIERLEVRRFVHPGVQSPRGLEQGIKLLEVHAHSSVNKGPFLYGKR